MGTRTQKPLEIQFDRLNGDLYIADVGQGAREEVNRQAADSTGGENYGWRCMEGLSCTGLPGCTCNSVDLTPPVHDYTHAGGNCSVTGGYMYRGAAIPELDGTYFFADFCTGRIWSFVWQGNSITQFQERTGELQPESGGAINNITSFGEDDSGEIYIVDKDGEIFKIVEKIGTTPTPAPTPQPTPAPGGDPILSGFSPNRPGTRNTVTVTNAPQGARVNFKYSTRSGTTSISSGVCSGQSYDLSRAGSLGSATADSSGTAAASVRLSRRSGGRTYYLQASVETGSSCPITNRVEQIIGSSGGGGGGGTPPGDDNRRPSRRPRWGR